MNKDVRNCVVIGLHINFSEVLTFTIPILSFSDKEGKVLYRISDFFIIGSAFKQGLIKFV